MDIKLSFSISLLFFLRTDSNCDEDKGMFKCKNKKCIEQDLICNGNNDCGDGSDERKKVGIPGINERNQCGMS